VTTVAAETAATKTCRRCGIPQPLDQYPHQRAGDNRRSPNCVECTRTRKRELERARWGDPNPVTLPVAGDNTPARQLRIALAEAREHGDTFDQAWDGAIDRAILDLRGRDRAQWQHAFATTSPNWKAAYLRRPFDGCTMPFILD
jgi:hypothetical protein